LSLDKISPFTIHRSIKGGVGSVIKTKRLRNGTLLVETASEAQSKKLLNLTQLTEDVKVSVTPHRSLNYSRGVIHCPALNDIAEDEIRNELLNQNVITVKRLNKKVKGKITKSHSYLLRFLRNELPTFINVGYLVLPVRPYIPAPTLCHRCFTYNHQTKHCQNQEKCFWCGNEKHTIESGKCHNPPKCLNCQDNHYSSSKKCPIYLKEKKIIEIEHLNKIPYIKARELFNKSHSAKSYASIAQRMYRNSSTQTETELNDRPLTLNKQTSIKITPVYRSAHTQTNENPDIPHSSNCTQNTVNAATPSAPGDYNQHTTPPHYPTGKTRSKPKLNIHRPIDVDPLTKENHNTLNNHTPHHNQTISTNKPSSNSNCSTRQIKPKVKKHPTDLAEDSVVPETISNQPNPGPNNEHEQTPDPNNIITSITGKRQRNKPTPKKKL